MNKDFKLMVKDTDMYVQLYPANTSENVYNNDSSHLNGNNLNEVIQGMANSYIRPAGQYWDKGNIIDGSSFSNIESYGRDVIYACDGNIYMGSKGIIISQQSDIIKLAVCPCSPSDSDNLYIACLMIDGTLKYFRYQNGVKEEKIVDGSFSNMCFDGYRFIYALNANNDAFKKYDVRNSLEYIGLLNYHVKTIVSDCVYSKYDNDIYIIGEGKISSVFGEMSEPIIPTYVTNVYLGTVFGRVYVAYYDNGKFFIHYILNGSVEYVTVDTDGVLMGVVGGYDELYLVDNYGNIYVTYRYDQAPVIVPYDKLDSTQFINREGINRVYKIGLCENLLDKKLYLIAKLNDSNDVCLLSTSVRSVR